MNVKCIVVVGILLASSLSWAMEWDQAENCWRSLRKTDISAPPSTNRFISVEPMIANAEQAEKQFSITPDSFNSIGKSILAIAIEHMHAASTHSGVTTGLAAICNAIAPTQEGAEALIHDQVALKWTNEYNECLSKTTYPNQISTFDEIWFSQADPLENLPLDIQRTMMQIALYPTVMRSSDIRMPEQNMAMAFVGTDVATNGRLLEKNKNIDPDKNEYQAKASMLLCAYCTQQFINSK